MSNIVNLLAKHFTPYISVTGLVENQTYPYRESEKGFPNERFPIVSLVLHLEKCKGKGKSWLYIAVDEDADLSTLDDKQQLYVGSQTEDRMFRGAGLKGKNFHHNEMRKGNGEQNLINYLQSEKKVKIYVIAGSKLSSLVEQLEDFKGLPPLINRPSFNSKENHPGFWFEQLILRESSTQWAWNTNGADKKAIKIMNELGL
jgi:hypothetical protein